MNGGRMTMGEGGIELGSGPVRSVQSIDGARDESGKRAGSFPVGNSGRWAIKADVGEQNLDWG
jgi:hypothetical protein